MKASDMEEIRHAINRLRAKASEGATMQTSTVMNETAIVMDAIYRAEREPIPAVSPPARRETWETLRELDSALCQFTNAATDDLGNPMEWAEETNANFRALCDAYNNAHAAGVFRARATEERDDG